MAAGCDQNSYEGSFTSYRINLHFTQTKVTLGAEHRHTKRIYHAEINQNNISDMTQGLCETCEQLFELLQELIDNNGIDKNKDLQIVEQETKLILNVILKMSFGRTSREFSMKFELESIQLDDITRLENIVNEHAQRLEQLEWSMNDRFDHASKLVSLYNNSFQFRSLSETNIVKLSDNNRTISSKVQQQHQQDIVVTTTQPFIFPTNKRYQLIRFNIQWSAPFSNDQILIGIVYQPDKEELSTITSSSGTWLLDVSSGCIQHSYFRNHPYTWSQIGSLSNTSHSNVLYPSNRPSPAIGFVPNRNRSMVSPQMAQQHNSNAHVDLLLDTQQRCLAFRLEDQTEDQWAFYLPKHVQINEVYPLIVLRNPNIIISIDS